MEEFAVNYIKIMVKCFLYELHTQNVSSVYINV